MPGMTAGRSESGRGGCGVRLYLNPTLALTVWVGLANVPYLAYLFLDAAEVLLDTGALQVGQSSFPLSVRQRETLASQTPRVPASSSVSCPWRCRCSLRDNLGTCVLQSSFIPKEQYSTWFLLSKHMFSLLDSSTVTPTQILCDLGFRMIALEQDST